MPTQQEQELTQLRQLILEQVPLCKDADLLDLVHKLLMTAE